jgi:UDP-N-acetylglucosamine 1-carboxyvinyltransferase
MEKIVIEGGKKLSGVIDIGGAKNAVLPLMASGIMVTDGTLILRNVPRVLDVITMRELLGYLGLKVEDSKDTIKIHNSNLSKFNPPAEFVTAMRASVLVMGPLLGRYGRVVTPLPGGCAIGDRPIDQHLEAFKAMGARVKVQSDYVEIECDKLKGTEFTFKKSTVTGTGNAIMSAVFADGETVLHNCAREPEIVELSDVLNRMGAKISGAGTETIVIKGVSSLKGVEHNVMSDRIEAGTYIIAGVLAGEELKIRNIVPEHINALLNKLKECGADFCLENNSIMIKGGEKLIASDVVTEVYPGFPTDLQAQFMSLMCFADGKSKIKESIFENRFQHVKELKKMGADIVLDGNVAYINGGRRLRGATVRASDLRASACLVIAGLGAEGVTEIEGLEHLDRGYEKIEDKLSGAGARIKRVKK